MALEAFDHEALGDEGDGKLMDDAGLVVVSGFGDDISLAVPDSIMAQAEGHGPLGVAPLKRLHRMVVIGIEEENDASDPLWPFPGKRQSGNDIARVGDPSMGRGDGANGAGEDILRPVGSRCWVEAEG